MKGKRRYNRPDTPSSGQHGRVPAEWPPPPVSAPAPAEAARARARTWPLGLPVGVACLCLSYAAFRCAVSLTPLPWHSGVCPACVPLSPLWFRHQVAFNLSLSALTAALSLWDILVAREAGSVAGKWLGGAGLLAGLLLTNFFYMTGVR